jgi:hypothetical protein
MTKVKMLVNEINKRYLSTLIILPDTIDLKMFIKKLNQQIIEFFKLYDKIVINIETSNDIREAMKSTLAQYSIYFCSREYLINGKKLNVYLY